MVPVLSVIKRQMLVSITCIDEVHHSSITVIQAVLESENDSTSGCCGTVSVGVVEIVSLMSNMSSGAQATISIAPKARVAMDLMMWCCILGGCCLQFVVVDLVKDHIIFFMLPRGQARFAECNGSVDRVVNQIDMRLGPRWIG